MQLFCSFYIKITCVISYKSWYINHILLYMNKTFVRLSMELCKPIKFFFDCYFILLFWFASSENGLYEEDLKLPDTITQWVGRAVCVHPTKGVGLSAPSSITTFTPFFVDLTLLPSIRQGEIMPIVISVFNYLNRTLPVSLWDTLSKHKSQDKIRKIY